MANLIKKIKIKKQDGTFTDYIPIGAEAQNVDMQNGTNVEQMLTNLSNQDGEIIDNLNNQIKNHNTFCPIPFASMYILDTNVETVKGRILKWKDVGCKGIIVTINFTSTASGEITLEENLNEVKTLMQYAKDHGLIVNTIKFHCLLANSSLYDNMTFFDLYLTKVQDVLVQLDAKNFGVTRVTVLNELTQLWGRTTNQTRVNKAVEIVNTIKELGYEVGITFANLELGIGVAINYAPSLIEALDFFAFNYYQAFVYHGANTTYEDSKISWEHALDAILTYKDMYPNKPWILSETGCTRYWDNLINPANYTIYTGGESLDGRIYNVYFYGLFENQVLNQVLDEVWFWYFERPMNSELTCNFIKSYLGGNINE